MSDLTPNPSPKRGGEYDVIVIGAGLAGMLAGTLAAKRGARTLVIARGLGGTHVGAGTVDMWGYDSTGQLSPYPNPPSSVDGGGNQHPLALAGEEALRSGLNELQAMCATAGYPLVGSLAENFFLPTALGAIRPTCLAPESFANGEVRHAGEMVLARLAGFRDFFADLMAANLNAAGYAARALSLTLPDMPTHRDAFATDLARLFDEERYREQVAMEWRAAVKGVERLGLPAIVGLREAHTAWLDLQEKLEVELFEIPILPPSVPGMRLFNGLKHTLEAHGGRLTVGPGITGWVTSDCEGAEKKHRGRASGVVAETAGGPRHYAARFIILATGGFRHGGLEAKEAGRVTESVFNLPVVSEGEWFASLYWGAHPYARFGVRVNEKLQPVNEEGEVVYENVFAIGGLLAGADRNGEGSREGIDVATAWKAVQAMTNEKQ